MRRNVIRVAIAGGLAALLMVWWLCGRASADTVPVPAGMVVYDSPYYEIHSDIGPARVKEAVLRMTLMAQEYHERTKEFSGAIRSKLPFYLFKNASDYYAAGGLPKTGGVFMVRGQSSRLMAIAREDEGTFLWHVVQHEGFHQFAHAYIGELPPWLNEGLAEYFGEGVFTGDGMVTGLIPPYRCKKVQECITNHEFKSVRSMLLLSHADWNAQVDPNNYHMAWSMVHFLAHGDDGKYQKAFSQFIREINRGRPWAEAWQANLGPVENFEAKWKQWWLAQDPGMASKVLYVKAVVSTLTSFAGRAKSQNQTFENIQAFLDCAKSESIKIPANDWLPPGLLASTLRMKKALGEEIGYELGKSGQGVQVIATLPDKTRVIGTYNRAARTGRVAVAIDDFPAKIAAAKALLDAKKKSEAKAILLEALKRNPQSPSVSEARELLKQLS